MKLIASDYDGTLNRNGISRAVQDALAAWQAVGNKFGIVSGRGLVSLSAVIKHDPVICDFLIAANGALACDKDRKILFCHTLSGILGKRIAAFVLENGGYQASVNTLSGEYLIVSPERKARHKDDTYYRLLDGYDTAEAFYEISTYLDTEEDAFAFTNRLHEAFGGSVTGLVNGSCIDIVPCGVNKAKGIEELCTCYGIAADDVVTVGDNYNDAEMLRAYRSYAVSNAVPYIKEIADTVVEDIAELCEKENMISKIL